MGNMPNTLKLVSDKLKEMKTDHDAVSSITKMPIEDINESTFDVVLELAAKYELRRHKLSTQDVILAISRRYTMLEDEYDRLRELLDLPECEEEPECD